ncbi:MAG: hypothetical protein H8E55_75365, partial [Pelagibacterales bacterium]|nr:hypothetical protein [Pelagibacterales bacterium]
MIKRYLLISMGIYSLSFAYNVGDYVNMIDQEKEFDVCYGSTDDIVKLSDYNGDLNGGMYHVIHIDMADGEVVASSDTINNLAKFLKTEVETKENKNGDKEFIFPEYNRWELYDSIRGMSAELRSKTNEELDQMPSQEILTTLAVPGLTRETNKARKIR